MVNNLKSKGAITFDRFRFDCGIVDVAMPAQERRHETADLKLKPVVAPGEGVVKIECYGIDRQWTADLLCTGRRSSHDHRTGSARGKGHKGE